MKKLIVLTLTFGAFSVQARLPYLMQSVGSTLSVIAQDHDLEGVEAIEAMMTQSEVETLALLHDETRGNDEVLEFGCHLHGNNMACHPHGHSHLKGANFTAFRDAIIESFKYTQKVLTARGINDSAVESVKFWKAGHEHLNKSGVDDVFAKYTYEANGQDVVFYNECHYHDSQMECHAAVQGEDEPDLGGGHQH